MVIGIVIGTLFVLSVPSWPLVWLGLELNLICFIPSVINEGKNQAIIYFIIQSIGSLVVLSISLLSDLSLSLFLFLGLILKLGAAPLHFWLPSVLSSLDNTGFYITISWQKVAPILLTAFSFIPNNFFILSNLALGSIIIISMSSPSTLVIFSGISQIGWILILFGKSLVWYIFIYFIILLPIVLYMKSCPNNFFWGIVNAGGLPPFSGFFINLNVLLSTTKPISLFFHLFQCYCVILIRPPYN